MTSSFVVFLPWLRLADERRVAGVGFLPFRDQQGRVAPLLRESAEPLTKILSSYRNQKGQNIDNCVVATLPDRGCRLSEDDFEPIRWAASLLFLSSWACNEYGAPSGEPYVNSAVFSVVGQKYSAPVPEYISLVSRRRDGSHWAGGYRHGEVTFTIPTQCMARDGVAVDDAFLFGLDAAVSARSRTAEALRLALPFAMLANSDDAMMTRNAEAILMASAFEQLMNGPAKSYGLGKKFGVLFHRWGDATVAEARIARPDIKIDTTKTERAAAQPTWWVHRKWMEELYDVRSKAAHRGYHTQRPWGWALHEHLLMAAFVFPLVAKILLQRDGYYTLTDDDDAACRCVDKLLAISGWDDERDGQGDHGPCRWREVVTKTKVDAMWRKAHERAIRNHSQRLADRDDAG